MIGINVEAADRTNAEMEARKILKNKKLNGDIFSVEEA